MSYPVRERGNDAKMLATGCDRRRRFARLCLLDILLRNLGTEIDPGRRRRSSSSRGLSRRG